MTLALLDLSLPSLDTDEAPTPAVAEAERALLSSIARTADGPELRAQALVELMALEASCGDELAFERLRHELVATELAPAVEALFRARVAWGLARFGRLEAARRWARIAALSSDGADLRDWLLELDRLLALDGR
jgi:phosphotransferase system HPr-like phosphotransfer protein